MTDLQTHHLESNNPEPNNPESGNADYDNAVEIRGLVKRFGNKVAVNNVDLTVKKGSAFGYLGPNGAGKTTLIRSLLGLTKANHGKMWIRGLEVPKYRTEALSRVGAIVDEPRFFGHLSGKENLMILASHRGANAESRIMPSLDRVGIADRANDKVKGYSMGMRQRLGIAACLISDPELLILDEPMNGLDPAGMQDMRSFIRNFVDDGGTIMLSSHLLDEIEKTCDAVAIVDRGSVIRQGSIEGLLSSTEASVIIECSSLNEAAKTITDLGIVKSVSIDKGHLTVILPESSDRELLAIINKSLVTSGISVYQLQEVKTSLEDWFLSVTTKLGDQ